MTRLRARLAAAAAARGGEPDAAPLLDLTLPAGTAAALPDRDDVVAWLGGQLRPRRRAARRDQLVVDGRRLTRRSPAARVRAGLVVVGEPPVAPAVPVGDHIAAATSRRAALDLLDGIPRLAGRADDPAGVLSGGERRLLGWARAVLVEPTVVVLDRAGTGLDADALAWADARVARWRADGAVVLVRVGRAEEIGWVRDDG